MFEVPRVIALVNDPGNTELFHRLGIQATFSAADLLARLIEEQAAVADLVSLLPLAGGRAHIIEVGLTDGAPAAGRAIRDLNPPEGALIAGVIRADAFLVPSGATTLLPGDRLVLLTQPEQQGPFLRLLLGEHA